MIGAKNTQRRDRPGGGVSGCGGSGRADGRMNGCRDGRRRGGRGRRGRRRRALAAVQAGLRVAVVDRGPIAGSTTGPARATCSSPTRVPGRSSRWRCTPPAGWPGRSTLTVTSAGRAGWSWRPGGSPVRCGRSARDQRGPASGRSTCRPGLAGVRRTWLGTWPAGSPTRRTRRCSRCWPRPPVARRPTVGCDRPHRIVGDRPAARGRADLRGASPPGRGERAGVGRDGPLAGVELRSSRGAVHPGTEPLPR